MFCLLDFIAIIYSFGWSLGPRRKERIGWLIGAIVFLVGLSGDGGLYYLVVVENAVEAMLHWHYLLLVVWLCFCWSAWDPDEEAWAFYEDHIEWLFLGKRVRMLLTIWYPFNVVFLFALREVIFTLGLLVLTVGLGAPLDYVRIIVGGVVIGVGMLFHL